MRRGLDERAGTERRIFWKVHSEAEDACLVRRSGDLQPHQQSARHRETFTVTTTSRVSAVLTTADLFGWIFQKFFGPSVNSSTNGEKQIYLRPLSSLRQSANIWKGLNPRRPLHVCTSGNGGGRGSEIAPGTFSSESDVSPRKTS